VPERQAPRSAQPFSTVSTLPVERTSTVSSVARRLLDELGSGNFAPGTRLPAERELAATLQVSRSTLREAMAALDILGIIEVRPGSGSYLKANSAELLPQALKWGLMLGQPGAQDLIEVREHLEILAATLAASRATDDDVERLQRFVDGMQVAESVEEFVDADVAFHLEMATIARNAVLSDILHSVRSLLLAWFDRTLRVPGTMQATLAEHVAVFEAIKARSPEAAEAAMRVLMDAADLRLKRALHPA
jgi:GntR family transcriptional regulator, transcriptional repressor for pyruvate dehydrogenase complex